MKTRILYEHGVAEALFGIGMSYGITSQMSFEQFVNSTSEFTHISEVAERIACRDNGENKFLESISVWLDISAPRYWWIQFATYRIGVSSQSESTMHTIMNTTLCQDDFEGRVDTAIIDTLNELILQRNFYLVIRNLPQSYIQRRIITTNYKAIRHIYQQRKDHKLLEWSYFFDEIINDLEFSKFITGREK